MVKVVYQFVPGILQALYDKAVTNAYNDGFQYYLYEYTDLPGYVVRTR